MKDIAIYRLKRIEQALARLNAAVMRLDQTIDDTKKSKIQKTIMEENSIDKDRDTLLDVELKYNNLKAVSSSVLSRIEKIIKNLEL